jgi:hypothetical protein
MIPLPNIVVTKSLRCFLETETLPKLFTFATLFHYNEIRFTLFMSLKMLDMLHRCAFVLLEIANRDFVSNPEPNISSCLNNKHCSRVQHFSVSS